MKATNYVSLPITLEDVLDDKKFRIPIFQRSVVWNNARRKEFIQNVRNGEPFGVILVRLYDGKYELIDGLQRVTSLRAYNDNKFEYLDEKDIDISLVEKLVKVNLSIQGLPNDEKYIREMSIKVQLKIFECLKDQVKPLKMMKALREEFSFPEEDEIYDAIEEIIDDFEKSTDISGLSILAINYTGPSENIPNVFYNLNTGGVALSKYETLAPLWSRTLFKIDDEQLLSLVDKKYTDLEEASNLEVDYNPEDIREKGISLFEYCYALSGIIRDKEQGFDILFPDNSKSTDPIGFEMLSLILDRRVNQAEKLQAVLENKPAKFLLDLKRIIVEALSASREALKDTIVGYADISLCSDSMYLIYHMIVSYIWEYYHIDSENAVIVEKDDTLPKSDFRKYARLHYVCDCISDYWKVNRQVTDLDREIHNAESRRRYWHSISMSDWSNALDAFMESQSGVAKTIPQKNKLFINYLIKLKLKADSTKLKYFTTKYDDEINAIDFEHITPQKIIVNSIKDLSTSKQKRYPISAVGNLCYLSAKDNRSKREKTIYENMKDRPSYVSDEEYLKLISYPNEEDLGFIHLNNSQFRDAYEKFVESRQNKLKQEFLDLIKIY